MNMPPKSSAKILLAGEACCGVIIVLHLIVLLNAAWLFPDQNQLTIAAYSFGIMQMGLWLTGIVLLPAYFGASPYLQGRRVRHITVYLLVLVFIPILVAAQIDYARRAIAPSIALGSKK